MDSAEKPKQAPMRRRRQSGVLWLVKTSLIVVACMMGGGGLGASHWYFAERPKSAEARAASDADGAASETGGTPSVSSRAMTAPDESRPRLARKAVKSW